MSWPLHKLKDCCTVVGGATPKREVSSYWGGDIPWITPKDISNLSQPVLEDAPEFLTKAGFDSAATFMLPKGAILLTSRAPIGNVAIAGREMCTNQGFKSLIPGENIDSGYLYHCMRNESRRLEGMGNGATFKEVSKKVVEDFQIPVPPLPEQKRIAAILDKADAIRRKRQQAIELADQFLRSVFLDLFSKHFTTKGYEIALKKPIKKLVSYIDYRGKTPEKSSSGVPLITAKNVKRGYISEEPREFILELNYEAWMSRGFPKANDVLFTTEAPLGNAALLGEYERVAVGQRLVALRSRGELTQEFLLFALMTPLIQGLIDSRSSGSTAKGIRTAELYKIELPVPDLRDQKTFSLIYRKSAEQKDLALRCSGDAVQFFDSLSQRAFAGQL